jgi:hypothetical protein
MYLGGNPFGLGLYYLKNGQTVSQFTVGDSMMFNVPGYSEVWLDQTQNGATQFSGVMPLPMGPYTLLPRDVGSFAATVYEVKNGGKGKLIGSDSATVVAAAAPVVAPPRIIQAPTPIEPPPGGGGTVTRPGGTGPTGGPYLLPTGVSTPTIITLPGGGSYVEPAGGPPVEAAGMFASLPEWLPMALFAGAAVWFLSGSGRRR